MVVGESLARVKRVQSDESMLFSEIQIEKLQRDVADDGRVGGRLESSDSRDSTIAEDAGCALSRTAASEASDTTSSKSSTITPAIAAS